MRTSFVLFSLVALGCGSSAPKSDFADDPTPDQASGGDTSGNGETQAGGSSGGGSGGDNGNFGSGDAGPGAGAVDDCSDAAKLVYVVSDENGLYSFAPDTLTFTSIGTLNCPTAFASPNSMAVDRSGTAWVNYSDGTLFKVSTKDASCEATSFKAGQHGLGRFGMAFVSNAAGSSEETLFIAGIDSGSGQGLGKVDLKTMKVTMIGDYDGTLRGENAELTGTGNGTLFGFFTTSPATFAQIDKASAKTSNKISLSALKGIKAWAFSFWGGDFWFYSSTGGASQVTRLKASGDGSQSVVVKNVGNFQIVGAGVSTCAPTVPPPTK